MEIRCPRCSEGAFAGGAAQCAVCGLTLAAEQVAELKQLAGVTQWAADRRDWIVAMAEYTAAYPAGVVVPAPVGAGAMPAVATTPRTSGAQGALLAAGAFALVAAGITFVAVAWGTLSDAGRFLLLLAGGVIALAVAWFVAPRIKATATTLAVAGSLLIAVDAAFLVVRGDASDAVAIAALVAGLGVAGMAFGRRARSRLPGAAAVVALVGSGLLLLIAIAYPALADLELAAADLDDANQTGYALWATVALAVWGMALLGWAMLDDTAPWPWPATFSLLVAAGLLADLAMGWLPDSVDPELWWSAGVAVWLLAAAALLLWDRLTGARWSALLVGALLMHFLALLQIVGATDSPQARPWMALALLLWSASWVGVIAHARRHHPSESRALELTSPWLGALLGAAAVALLATSWQPRPDWPAVATAAEVAAEYPWWRGALVAVVSCAIAAGLLAWLRRRSADGDRDTDGATDRRLIGWLPAWPVVVLVVWATVANSDAVAATGFASPSGAGIRPPIAAAVSAAAVITGFGVIGLAAWARRPLLLWLGAATTTVGIGIGWDRLSLDVGGWEPELVGLTLAVAPALAGALHVLVAGERRVPSLITIAPALTALLLPSTVAVLGDTADRWFSGIFGGADPVSTAGLVRGLTLVVVAAVGVAVGARQRLAGVFWPALACLVAVVGAQLVDLADRVPPWIVLAIVGIALVAVGARWEWVRRQGRQGRQWAAELR